MGRSTRRVGKLSSGRSTLAHHNKARFSAKAGRDIIRSHHQLNKALVDAERLGKADEATRLRAEIERNGGIVHYQQASLLGQSNDRGGDSSRILVQWLKPRVEAGQTPLQLLEVGALSTSNACSQWRALEVTRIDLNAQASGIEQQDFMERPLPSNDSQKFDIISLSLVLNYVPSKEGRGQMLLRTREFLKSSGEAEGCQDQSEKAAACLPCLFLVLPAPCVLNSRYMTEKRLGHIMNSMGYTMIENKITSKLVYSLWSYQRAEGSRHESFKKNEINPGKGRNNFAIVT